VGGGGGVVWVVWGWGWWGGVWGVFVGWGFLWVVFFGGFGVFVVGVGWGVGVVGAVLSIKNGGNRKIRLGEVRRDKSFQKRNNHRKPLKKNVREVKGEEANGLSSLDR